MYQIKQALCVNGAKFRAALARAPPFQRDQPEYQCKLVFQVWKENTQSPTYGALRSALDKYSVFCGRNPLVSCEFVQVHATCVIAWLRKWVGKTDSIIPYLGMRSPTQRCPPSDATPIETHTMLSWLVCVNVSYLFVLGKDGSIWQYSLVPRPSVQYTYVVHIVLPTGSVFQKQGRV